MMRIISQILVLLFYAGLYGLGQEIDISGRVSIHNSKYETGQIIFVKGTYITAAFSKNANSDNNGKYTLTFAGIPTGQAVKISAEKAGLEVVNDYDLRAVVLGRTAPLDIYLTKKGHLAMAQTELYDISKKALYAEKDALIAKLRAGERESKAAINQLEKRLGTTIQDRFEAEKLLMQRVNELEKRLPEYALNLATQNLDFANESYIKAFEQFKKGDIENAIKYLDNRELTELSNQAIAGINEGKKLEAEGKALQEKSIQQLKQAVNSFELKAEAFELLFRYDSAAEQYEKIVDLGKSIDIGRYQFSKAARNAARAYYLDANYDKALAAQLLANKSTLELLGDSSLEIATCYTMTGLIYTSLWKFDEAIEHQQRAINIESALFKSPNEELAVCYNNMAIALHEKGEFNEALKFQEKNLAIKRALFDTMSLSYSLSLHNLGDIYVSLANYKDAEACLTKALQLREPILGTNHPEISDACIGISELYQAVGKYDLSIPYIQKAISIIENIYGKNNYHLARCYNSLATSYSLLEEYDTALVLRKQAIGFLTLKKEPDDPRYAMAIVNLGESFLDVGEAEKGYTLVSDAVAYLERKGGKDLPDLAECYHTLSLICQHLQKYDEAERLCRQAIALKAKRIGNANAVIARYLNTLSAIFLYSNKLDSALEYVQRAISITKEQLGPLHAHLSTYYGILASTYAAQEKYPLALIAEQDAIKIEAANSQYLALSTSYNNAALYHFHTGKVDSALFDLENCLTILHNHGKEKDPEYLKAVENYSFCLAQSGQKEDALKYRLIGIGIRKSTKEPSDTSLALAHFRAAELFAQLGLPDSAITHAKKALAIWEVALPADLDLASCYFEVSGLLFKVKETNDALEFVNKANRILEKKGNNTALGNYYWFTATLYDSLNNPGKKLEYELRSVTYFEQVPNVKDSPLIGLYHQISATLIDTFRYEAALGFEEKAISIGRKYLHADDTIYAGLYGRKGVILIQLQRFQEAINCFKATKDILERAKGLDPVFLSIIYSYIGDAYDSLNLFDSALNYYKNCLEIQNQVQAEKDDIASTYRSMATCQSHKKDYSKAIELLNYASLMSDSYRDGDYKSDVAVAYARSGKFDNAKNALEDYQKRSPGTTRGFVSWCIYYSLIGQKQQALDSLTKAIDSGFADVKWLSTNESLNNLRNEPRFKLLLAKIRKKTSVGTSK